MSRPIVFLSFLTVIAVGVVAVYVWADDGDTWAPPPGSGRQWESGGLQTGNRDRLAICVQDVNSGASESKAKARVEIVLIEVQQHGLWETVGFGERDPRVDVGCPSPSLLLRPDAEVTDLGKGTGLDISSRHRVVEEASHYRVFVFLLESEALARTFGTADQLANQETLRFGDQGVGVTSGLYFSPEGIDDRQLLIDCLRIVLGLRTLEQQLSCKE